MAKLMIFLCAALVWVVYGWKEDEIPVTADDCVESINYVSGAFSLGDSEIVSTGVINAIAAAETKVKNDLAALVLEARTQPTIKVYHHELRRLEGVHLPISCNRAIAYKVAKICNDAAESVLRARFFNGPVKGIINILKHSLL